MGLLTDIDLLENALFGNLIWVENMLTTIVGPIHVLFEEGLPIDDLTRRRIIRRFTDTC